MAPLNRALASAALASVIVSGYRPLQAESPAVTVRRVPHGGLQPQVAAIADGTIHLVYFLGEPRRGDLFYARSHDGGATFAPPLGVNSTRGSAIATGTIRGAQVAVGPGGRVHVAWNASDNTGMLYARSNDQGTAFEPQRNLIRQTSGIDGGGGLAVDPGGNVYVAWHASERDAAPGEAGRRVWVARSEDEGRTFATERPAWDEPTGACGCCGMAFSADGLGNVYALYRSARELVHRDVAADGRSASPAISPPGDARSRKHPRLAVNSAGEVLLVWTEGTAWARGGSLAWRLFGPDGRALAESGVRSDLPAWSFGAAAAQADGTFTVFY